MTGNYPWILLTAILFCAAKSYCSAKSFTKHLPTSKIANHNRRSILNYGPLAPWGMIYSGREECMQAMNYLKPEDIGAYNDVIDVPSCAALWDGLLCWPETSAGNNLYQSCPNMPGLDPNNFAKRSCGQDGRWLGEEKLGATGKDGWTDYRPCYTPYALALYQATYGDL